MRRPRYYTSPAGRRFRLRDSSMGLAIWEWDPHWRNGDGPVAFACQPGAWCTVVWGRSVKAWWHGLIEGRVLMPPLRSVRKTYNLTTGMVWAEPVSIDGL